MVNKQQILLFPFSNITLKINGVGTYAVFAPHPTFQNSFYPDEVHINGIKQSDIKNNYDFFEEDNIIELIWYNNNINDCQNMFSECTKITEMDLSNFDTSNVIKMWRMFFNCVELTSINLTNFNIPKAQDIRGLFKNCKKLTSIDLSSFDTSKAILIQGMFDGCSSLILINLSHFDTSDVNQIYELFLDCKNLEYIILPKFDESKLTDVHDMFKNVPENIVVCMNEDNTKKILP